MANEEAIGGLCERCGGPTEVRTKDQWMLAITKYADRLDKDLDTVDYLEKIKIQQRNWIGKSEGAEIDFLLNFTSDPKLNDNRGPSGEKAAIKVFTTRPDTLFGATYLVLSPEHPWVTLATDDQHNVLENKAEVLAYVQSVKSKTEIERTDAGKEKTGVELKGVKAINPANGEEVQMFIADYVLAGYGTGAIMAVPAHDERDMEFAVKYNVPIKPVIMPESLTIMSSPSFDFEQNKDLITASLTASAKESSYSGSGFLINSGEFDGLKTEEARQKITDFVGGNWVTKFKLRDWVFSRQRYWGEPIPMINCGKCGWVPVPEDQLPVVLPEIADFKPTDDGQSPLAKATEWINTTCPKCGGVAKRETDTMPNWAGSSWYFLRYIDPKNNQDLASADKLKYWLPIDWYNGGMEHTTLHLLYSRFWHKFLFDLGMVPTSEPYQKRTSHGLILAEGGVKMSKSKGNVVNPDEIIKLYGADTLRVYEMFMGPFDQAVAWSTESIIGSRRFIERVWKLRDKVRADSDDAINILLNQTIKKVSADIEAMAFNTAISTLMILVNDMEKRSWINQPDYEALLKLLYPFSPHMVAELWQELGHQDLIDNEQWPVADESKLVSDVAIITVQVNGKVRGTVEVPRDADQEVIQAMALKDEKIAKWVDNQVINRVVFVPNKLINMVLN